MDITPAAASVPLLLGGEGALEFVASLQRDGRSLRGRGGLQEEDAGVEGRQPVPVAPQVLLALAVAMVCKYKGWAWRVLLLTFGEKVKHKIK